MQEKMKINYAGACIAQYDRFIGLFITLSNDRLLIVLLSCTYCRRLNVPCILKENINHLSNIDGTIQNAGYTFQILVSPYFSKENLRTNFKNHQILLYLSFQV